MASRLIFLVPLDQSFLYNQSQCPTSRGTFKVSTLPPPSSSSLHCLWNCGTSFYFSDPLNRAVANFFVVIGVVFFKSLNTISNPFLISLITTLVNVLSTPISFWMVERFGRRNLLILGGTGMVISQYIVGIIGVTVGQDKGKDTNKAAVSAMIAFICINISMFASTWGPCAWVVVSLIPFLYPF
jgi:MFS family permease